MVVQEKITITIPSDIKYEIVKLKKSLKVSMNSIYQDAIRTYVEQKKRERLRKEAESMIDYYNTDAEVKELTNTAEDTYEY